MRMRGETEELILMAGGVFIAVKKYLTATREPELKTGCAIV